MQRTRQLKSSLLQIFAQSSGSQPASKALGSHLHINITVLYGRAIIEKLLRHSVISPAASPAANIFHIPPIKKSSNAISTGFMTITSSMSFISNIDIVVEQLLLQLKKKPAVLPKKKCTYWDLNHQPYVYKHTPVTTGLQWPLHYPIITLWFKPQTPSSDFITRKLSSKRQHNRLTCQDNF